VLYPKHRSEYLQRNPYIEQLSRYHNNKMALSSDLEALKDVPGYNAILKAVLKSQIQLLVRG